MSALPRHNWQATMWHSLCLLALSAICGQVQAQNAIPVAIQSSINVLVSANAANPYVFKLSDFPFTDADGDPFELIRISSVLGGLANKLGPCKLGSDGALCIGNSAVVRLHEITKAQIENGEFIYYPPPGQSAQVNYTSFVYSVKTTGTFGGTQGVDMPIHLVERGVQIQARTGGKVETLEEQKAARRMQNEPFTEGTELIATLHDSQSTEENTTYHWFRRAEGSTGEGELASPTRQGVAVSSTTYTPDDEDVGKVLYVRATIEGASSYVSDDTPPVRNVNDAPVSSDSTISVDPDDTYTFRASSFRFTDNDIPRDRLASVEITSLPGKGSLKVNGNAATVGQVVLAANVNTITYEPEANAVKGDGYTSFTFKVKDDGSDPNTNTNTASATGATMTINLADDLLLRLRLFLEGPLQ